MTPEHNAPYYANIFANPSWRQFLSLQHLSRTDTHEFIVWMYCANDTAKDVERASVTDFQIWYGQFLRRQ